MDADRPIRLGGRVIFRAVIREIKMIKDETKNHVNAMSEEDIKAEISLGDKSRFQKEKFTYLKKHYRQRREKRADSASKNYAKMTWYLLRHNQTSRNTMLSLAAGTVSSWYAVWNLNYDNLVTTGIISIQTKKQLIEMAPNIIFAVSLIAFLLLNRHFINKYKDPSKLSDEELDKLLKYL